MVFELIDNEIPSNAAYAPNVGLRVKSSTIGISVIVLLWMISIEHERYEDVHTGA